MARPAGRAVRQAGSDPGPQALALGVVADADGIAVAAMGGTRSGEAVRLVPGALLARGWSGEERAALAAGDAEPVETAAATLVARLRADLPEAPALLGLAAAAPAMPDPAVLAEVAGLPVLWDFRSADQGLGGAGAPLAPPVWHGIARGLGWDAPFAVARLGRVCRLAGIDPRAEDPRDAGVLAALDTGPGPGFCALPPPGRKARQAGPRRPVLDAALGAPFFARMPPRRLGAGDLPDLPAALAALPPTQAGATLRALVAEGLAAALPLLPEAPARLILTGPGAADAGLVTRLRKRLALPVMTAAEAGLDPAPDGAHLVAGLALRVAWGLAIGFPGTTGVAAPVGGALVVRPGAG